MNTLRIVYNTQVLTDVSMAFLDYETIGKLVVRAIKIIQDGKNQPHTLEVKWS